MSALQVKCKREGTFPQTVDTYSMWVDSAKGLHDGFIRKPAAAQISCLEPKGALALLNEESVLMQPEIV